MVCTATEGDDRITPKIDALVGCHLLFCLAIGGPAAAKAVASHIHPIKAQPATIDDVLEKVRVMLTGSPPPWLRKVLQAAGQHDAYLLENVINGRRLRLDRVNMAARHADRQPAALAAQGT